MNTVSDGNRPCPVCGSEKFVHFADENIDASKMNAFTYSSRKQPEFMCLRLVQCLNCEVIYAPVLPSGDFLSKAYADAFYDSSEEAACAAASYAHALMPHVEKLEGRNAAVDVGTGSGPLLPWLIGCGFDPVIGIEPSHAAIAAAPHNIQPLIREGMFNAEMLSEISSSLICSFMTLEHINQPRAFVKIAYDRLEPGGMIAVVVHNRQGLLNRVLGSKSPIIDVEHLQLFNPKSITELLKYSGFEQIFVKPISNTYPLKYWLRLVPLPKVIKSTIEHVFRLMFISNIKIPMRVGNILAVGIKSKLTSE